MNKELKMRFLKGLGVIGKIGLAALILVAGYIVIRFIAIWEIILG